MKKMLAILSAGAIVASAGSMVLTVGIRQTVHNFISDLDLKIIAEQYAKVYHLNHQQGYDANMVFEQVVNDQQLSALTNSSLTNSTSSQLTYAQVSNKYLNTLNDSSLFASNTTFISQLKSVINMLGQFVDVKQLSEIVSTIHAAIQSDDIVINVAEMLQKILNANLAMVSDNRAVFEFLNTILTKENIKKIANGFSLEKYDGYTLQQALDSSIIGLTNAINQFAQTNVDDVDVNPANASNALSGALTNAETGVQRLLNKKVTNFNILSNFSYLIDVLDFVHMLGVYVNAFMTSTIDNDRLWNWDEIQAIRNKTITSDQVANELDLYQGLSYFASALDANNDSNGYMLRNLMNAFFWGKEQLPVLSINLSKLPQILTNPAVVFDDYATKDYSGSGLHGLIKMLLNVVLPEFSGVPLGSAIVTAIPVIMNNQNVADDETIKFVGSDVVVGLITSMLEIDNQLIKDLIIAVLKNTDNVLEEPWSAIWSGSNLLPPLLNQFFGNETISFSNVGDLLRNYVLANVQNADEIIPLTIPLLLNKLLATIQAFNQAASEPNQLKMTINFDDIQGMINSLINANGVSVLEQLLTAPNQLMQFLGVNEDSTKIVDNSFIYYLQKIEQDTFGLTYLSAFVISEIIPALVEEEVSASRIHFTALTNAVNDVVKVDNNQFVIALDNTRIKVEFTTLRGVDKVYVNNVTYLD